MAISSLRAAVTSVVVLGLAALPAACGDSISNPISPLNNFAQANLIADAAGATTIDANLVNPWGIAFGPTGILWVSNNGTGTSTLYSGTGTKNALTVTVPGVAVLGAGTPTGVVFNSTTNFLIPGAGAALFVFAGEDGTVAAWNMSTGSAAHVVADRSANGAVYKGVAIASNAGANFLYLTNFAQSRVDVFDGSYAFVRSFSDPGIPTGFAPFGIANIGGQLFVTFAKQQASDKTNDQPGAGNGFVDVFNADGTLSKRFASNGPLNSPWAVTAAPASFGAFSQDILVGNFGDGKLLAYNASTGAFVDVMRDHNKNPIVINGLWGLEFGPAAGSSTLYFASGPGGEQHGLVGTLTAQ